MNREAEDRLLARARRHRAGCRPAVERQADAAPSRRPSPISNAALTTVPRARHEHAADPDS